MNYSDFYTAHLKMNEFRILIEKDSGLIMTPELFSITLPLHEFGNRMVELQNMIERKTEVYEF